MAKVLAFVTWNKAQRYLSICEIAYDSMPSWKTFDSVIADSLYILRISVVVYTSDWNSTRQSCVSALRSPCGPCDCPLR